MYSKLKFLLATAGCVVLSRASVSTQIDVLTRHNDNARTGANLRETVLKPSKINNQNFGKLAYRPVDGNVYAQPLVVSQARIDGRGKPTNAVIIATEHNSVYAFDGEDTNQASTTAQLWHTGPAVLGNHIESLDLYKKIGHPTCADLTTEIGITGTPAIKLTKSDAPKTGVIFVAAKSASGTNYIYKLFSLSLANGMKLGEIVIDGEVRGSGAGSTGSDTNKKIRFNPLYELNRPALLLDGNTLYIAFGGHCDRGPYHGWIFAYDISNPGALKQTAIFCSTPNGSGEITEGRAGIWMSGEGPAADGSGNIYFLTGDGTYNGTTDYGNSVVKAKLSAGKLQPQGWFTPMNEEFLKNYDVDLGSGGPVLLPDSHLLLAGGKEGRMYLVDRDRMEKGIVSSLATLQITRDHDGFHYYNIYGTPVVWARRGELFFYFNGAESSIKQYRLIPDATPGGAGWKFDFRVPFRDSADCPTKPNCVFSPYPNFPAGQFGHADRDEVWMPGGFMSLSAIGNNDGTGILWITMPLSMNANHQVTRGVLRALDASDVSKPELWNSEATGNDNDRLGQFAKFCPPTVANGKVYVATFQQETIGDDGIHRATPGGDQPALAIYGLKH
jgi:hypothetical protein